MHQWMPFGQYFSKDVHKCGYPSFLHSVGVLVVLTIAGQINFLSKQMICYSAIYYPFNSWCHT